MSATEADGGAAAAAVAFDLIEEEAEEAEEVEEAEAETDAESDAEAAKEEEWVVTIEYRAAVVVGLVAFVTGD